VELPPGPIGTGHPFRPEIATPHCAVGTVAKRTRTLGGSERFDAYFAAGGDLLVNESLRDSRPFPATVCRLGNSVHGDGRRLGRSPAVPFAAVRFDVAAALLFAAVFASGADVRPGLGTTTSTCSSVARSSSAPTTRSLRRPAVRHGWCRRCSVRSRPGGNARTHAARFHR